MKRKWMMFSLSTFINKITKNKKWYPKNPKNIMRNKIKQTKKKIIKLSTPTKKLKSTWKVWTKPRMTKWIRNKNKMPSTSIIQTEDPRWSVDHLSNPVHFTKSIKTLISILAECWRMIIPLLIKEDRQLNKLMI